MTTDLPPPTPGGSGDPWTSRNVVIAIGAAVVLGVLLGLAFGSSEGGGYVLALIAFGAVLAIPVVAAVIGIRRARRHPGRGGREFLAGFLLALALQLGIVAIVFGTCLVAAQRTG